VDSGLGEAVHSRVGAGKPRFRIRTNPGQPFADLEDSASGGELSRILLALKSVLADSHRMPLLVFDEIETGVGPRLGLLLGRKLKALATHRQVLCITHLPQIAAFADRHLRIDKIQDAKVTHATLEVVEGDRRVDELAAMLGGGDETLARHQAQSLLDEAAAMSPAPESAAPKKSKSRARRPSAEAAAGESA
ncbi:MAG: hypothetical protein KDB53_21730, partial [Planctomycetes bacterium]|nr:hypothetical protein [Planctomycetota bacterium]